MYCTVQQQLNFKYINNPNGTPYILESRQSNSLDKITTQITELLKLLQQISCTCYFPLRIST